MPTINPIAMQCVGILAMLLFGLGLAVSGARGKFNVGIGTTPDPDHPLNRLVRAHGNTTEYAPFLAILFLIHGLQQPSNLITGLMIAATAFRVIFVFGFLTAATLTRPSVFRFIGALGTYVTGLWLACLLFVA
jgi:uncharacterized protein